VCKPVKSVGVSPIRRVALQQLPWHFQNQAMVSTCQYTILFMVRCQYTILFMVSVSIHNPFHELKILCLYQFATATYA
jgi:hypothetical protein